MNLFECTAEDCCHEWQDVDETSICGWCKSEGRILSVDKSWDSIFHGFEIDGEVTR